MQAWPWFLALTIACDRGHREAPAPPVPVPPPTKPATTSCTLAPIPTKLPLAPKRLVAIGDVHGDLAATRAALRAGKAIDEKDTWIGGDLVVVQTGDLLDRGDDESAIIEMLDRLDREARAAGGAVLYTLGNHELMNAARDFRYVTPGGMRDFGGDRPGALAPGGAWAKRLANHNVVAIVGDSVFSHAGVLPDWVTHVDEANLAARCWLDGQSGGPEQGPAVLIAEDSPLWTRVYGIPDQVDCVQLASVLAKLGAKRMVVGHTVQETGISSACDDTLWRIDVGLAKLYGGPIEVLEITDVPRVVRGAR